MKDLMHVRFFIQFLDERLLPAMNRLIMGKTRDLLRINCANLANLRPKGPPSFECVLLSGMHEYKAREIINSLACAFFNR